MNQWRNKLLQEKSDGKILECLSLLVCLDKILVWGCLCSLQFFSDQLCPKFYPLIQPESELLTPSLKSTLSFHWEQGSFRKTFQLKIPRQVPSTQPRVSQSFLGLYLCEAMIAVSSLFVVFSFKMNWSLVLLHYLPLVDLCSGIPGISKHFFFGRLVAVRLLVS